MKQHFTIIVGHKRFHLKTIVIYQFLINILEYHIVNPCLIFINRIITNIIAIIKCHLYKRYSQEGSFPKVGVQSLFHGIHNGSYNVVLLLLMMMITTTFLFQYSLHNTRQYFNV
uniref:Uncharacterized protein n=1 Tax=Drosophila-associated filamentous virus TaxID=2743186 RepID=A0A6M9U098_9VIRU|nr:putative protein 39 [Drosophila-associated filamentous virus]